MSIMTFLVKIKRPTVIKQHLWKTQQQEYARCVNWCVKQLQAGKKLTSKHVPHHLKSAIQNEAIRRAKKAISDHKAGRAKTISRFKNDLPLSINNQNWDTRQIQLLRKGKDWYVALPVEVSCEITNWSAIPQTRIGVDVGVRHIAVVSEPTSGKRQFFSGKEVGYKRRHYRSLRQSLGKKKALRAIKRIKDKEQRWMTDYNRKLAKAIVDYALSFPQPVIQMEQLTDIRNTCRSMKRADRTIHSWAFYQLQSFIVQRAYRCGVSVRMIDPVYTSQTCHVCGHREKANRHRDRFVCKKCGHRSHADLNASVNIARSTSVAE